MTPERRYVHTQVGWPIIIVIFVVALVVAVINVLFDLTIIGPLLVTLILALGLLFSTLTVAVDEQYVRIAFGPGLIRRSWKTTDIANASIVRNRWWYGWGIRYLPGLTLYNVSGFDAVEIQLIDGRRYRIGTDEPAMLMGAIVEARQGPD